MQTVLARVVVPAGTVCSAQTVVLTAAHDECQTLVQGLKRGTGIVLTFSFSFYMGLILC